MQRYHYLSLFAAAGLLPVNLPAMEVAGKQLEVYGQLHLSGDYVEPDVPGQDADFVLSSNSSRFGVRGEYPVDPRFSILYQIEQEVTVDEAADDNFATRNTFLGVSGSLGDLLVGRIDTPFKDLGGAFTLFGDTVGDQRALLGAAAFLPDGNDTDALPESGRNLVNQRGSNALLWRFATESWELRTLYSPNSDGAGVNDGNLDQDSSLVSVSGLWEQGPATAGVAYEHWDELAGSEVDAWRAGAQYDFGGFTLGGLFESIFTDDLPGLEREAFALNGAVPFSERSRLLLQWVHAMEVDEVDDSDADMFALGGEYDLMEQATVYAVYSTVRNGAAARYQGIDGGHGEELVTVAGGEPEAFSVGGLFRF